jgi:NifU-like protein
MGIHTFIEAFPWSQYSRKLQAVIEKPRNSGYFTKKESDERGVRFVEAVQGSIQDGNSFKMYWLLDKEDGTIIDAKYQVFGQSALIGALEAACDLCVGKNYDQARRLSTDLIDRHLRDKPNDAAFPKETFLHLNLVLEGIDAMSDQCMDLPLPTAYIASPVPQGPGDVLVGGYPGWHDLPLAKKIAVIEKVLDEDVRPYIALDAGGVTVLNLLHDKEVIISYQGSCTSCYSAVGTTLSYIQQTLRNKVHPDIVVIPDLDFDSPYPG